MPAEEMERSPLRDEGKTTTGRPRKTRPDGSYYSSDPKERYQQLRDDGKVGPQFGKLGGRPRKPRAAEVVAEHARKEADRIIGALDDALDEEQPIRVRMEAAQAFIRIEKDEASLQLDEDRVDTMPREQLEAEFAEMLSDPVVRGMLTAGDDGAGEHA